MAVKNTIPMLVDVYKNHNTASKTYGQFYGRVFPRDGLNLKGFAKHLAHHGKLATYEMLVLVLQNIVDCMKELLLEGVPVKLDGLGTFTAGIEGAGSATLEDYRTDVHIKGIRINFRPEGAGDEEDKLTKKVLLEQATFQLNDYVEVMASSKTDKNGKPLTYQVRTKIAQHGLVDSGESGGGGNGGGNDEPMEP